jgi:hypothetical protein
VAAYRREELVLAGRRRHFDRSLPLIMTELPARTEQSSEVAQAPWAEWLPAEPRDCVVLPDAEGAVSLRPLAPATSALLRALEEPRRLSDLARRLAIENGLDVEAVEPWVTRQVTELIHAGAVIDGRLYRALVDDERSSIDERPQSPEPPRQRSSVRGSGEDGSGNAGTGSQSERISSEEATA